MKTRVVLEFYKYSMWLVFHAIVYYILNYTIGSIGKPIFCPNIVCESYSEFKPLNASSFALLTTAFVLFAN